MKTKRIYIILAVALVVIVSACSKNRYCRCVDTDDTSIDTIIVNVDKSMKCKHLKQIGIERMNSLGGFETDSIHNYFCQEIPHGDVSSINNLPY